MTCLLPDVSGNGEAFCVVRAPSPAEEPKRRVSPQREVFQQEKQCMRLMEHIE
jgi:hypothetical protein